MLYKFAGFYVQMSPKYEYTQSMLDIFECNEDVPEDQILYVGYGVSDETINNYTKRFPQVSLGESEHIYFSADFFRQILDYDSMMFHSSAIKYNGRCYLFSALSGTGKSTHTALWQKIYGDKVKIINDDKPVLKYENGKVIAYGSPFAGGTHKFLNESGEVDSIIFIKRSENNSIKEISVKEAIPRIFEETIKKLGAEKMSSLLNMIDRICNNVRLFELSCNMEDEAAILAHDTLIKDDENES